MFGSLPKDECRIMNYERNAGRSFSSFIILHSTFSLPACSILRAARIDVLVPQRNPAGHALGVLETVLTENLHELHRPSAALAMHHDLVVLVPTQLVGMLLNLLERNQRRT